MRFVALDFETTGVAAGFPNEPWQLGLVAVEDGRVLAETKWETYFQVDAARPFSPRAPGRWAQMREELAAAPTFQELWPELAERLVGVPLVAHNATTERTVLVKRAPLTPFGPWLDTLEIVRKFWPILKSYKLGDLIRTFGLEGEVQALCPDRTWHDALYDACAGAVLFKYVVGITGLNIDGLRRG
ncbi:MAG: hypothetical protein MJ240_08660 [Kiritimatiellae bacterium]|nr:hypothetical protein [Kiritimatiellia bacterium]